MNDYSSAFKKKELGQDDVIKFTKALSSAIDVLQKFADKLQQIIEAVNQATGKGKKEDKDSSWVEFAAKIGTLVFSVLALVNSVEHFAKALDPGAVEAMSRAMADLWATIGTAVVPIFHILTDAIRQVAGEIFPVMQQLAPIIAQLTHAFVEILIPVVRVFAAIMTALMPVFKLFADLVDLVVQLISPLLAVFEALVKSLGGIIKVIVETFQPVLQLLGTVIHEVIGAFLKLIVWIARTIGADDFVNALVEALSPKDPKQGQTATGSAEIRTFEDLAKKFNLASINASGLGEEKKPTDLGDILNEIKEIKGNETIRGIAMDIREICQILKDNVPHPVQYIERTGNKLAEGDGETWGKVLAAPFTGGLSLLF